MVALGWQTDTFYSPILKLTVFTDSPIQVSSGILVHSILVDTKDPVFGYLVEDLGVFVCAH